MPQCSGKGECIRQDLAPTICVICMGVWGSTVQLQPFCFPAGGVLNCTTTLQIVACWPKAQHALQLQPSIDWVS